MRETKNKVIRMPFYNIPFILICMVALFLCLPMYAGLIYRVDGAILSSEKYNNCDLYVWDGSTSSIKIWAGMDVYNSMNNYAQLYMNGFSQGDVKKEGSNICISNCYNYKVSGLIPSNLISSTPAAIIIRLSGGYSEESTQTIYITKGLSKYKISSNKNVLILPNTNDNVYTEGTLITLNAIAPECHQFVKWSDNNIDNPRSVIVTQDSTFTAIFEKIKYNLSVDINDSEHGEITSQEKE